MGAEHQILIQIADIVFAISSDRPLPALWLEDAYRGFRAAGEPEVTVHARYDDALHIPLPAEDRIFDSERLWSLYRLGRQQVIALRSPVSAPVPYRLALLDSNLQRVEVYTHLPDSGEADDDFLPGPLDFPLSEVLMVCLLGQGRGLMIHACGVDDGGRGYLFAGNSTHGKTTMARLWRDRAMVLNDDRIVLRHRDGRFWMYGTPWHGDHTGVSPKGVPLDRVFYLRHAGTHQSTRRQGAAAASMLLARSFPPLWDPESMGFTLDFCDRLVAAVPCYELGFVPDDSVVEFVRCV